MASFSNGLDSVLDKRFARMTGGIVAGMWVGDMATDWTRANVVDVGFPGGDIAYSALAAVVAFMLLPNKWAMPLSLGMVAGSTMNEAQAQGVL